MDKAAEAWTADLERWLAPFLERLAYPAQRRWAPLYIAGLLAPLEEKLVRHAQALVSLTLARAAVPVCVALRLFLPEAWIGDEARRRRALAPEGLGFREKWRIALAEIDRVRAAGASFGTLLADADYGRVAAFRHALAERGLTWALAVLSTCTVYPANVRVIAPTRRRGQPHPDRPSQQVQAVIAALPPDSFRAVTWRRGGKGPLCAECAALRIKVADGPPIAAAPSTFPAPRHGWCVSGAPRASSATTSPTCRPRRRWSIWPN